MKMFQKSNIHIFLFFILGAVVLQSCDKDLEVSAPVAYFTASARIIIAGESITFTDASTGTVDSRQWQIEGGTPNSSNASSVVAQFKTDGTYTVQLTTTNTGGSNTTTLVVTVKPVTFVHTASSSNAVLHSTIIDHSATNGNPNAIVVVTSDFGTNGPHNNKALGVTYNTANGGHWTIFNQDITAIPIGARFNVLVKEPSDKAFAVTASSILGHIAIISHPSLNGNPDAKILVSQHFNSFFNNNPIGVFYTGTNWAVFNLNGADMPSGAKFNVIIDDKIFVETAYQTSSHLFYLNQSAINYRHNALIFVTQYWTSVFNANEIGVFYDGVTWAIFNQNGEIMPLNAKFMVFSN